MRSKAQALAQFLQGMAGAGRAYTLLQLARRLLSYCEAQVALSHPSAFPLAEVTAAVLAAHPDLAPILLGKLYEVSAYTAWCMAWHGLVHPGVTALEELALPAHAAPACARYAWRCSLGGAADTPLNILSVMQACPLAVPKVHILYKGRDEEEHLRLLGYKKVEQPGDAKTGRAPGLDWETTDAYVSSMQGYMMFYGALTQSEQQGNPVNLTHAWQFVAR